MKYRQGDVLFKKIDHLPKGLKIKSGLTVAYGEVTGHHHRFIGPDVVLYENPETKVIYADIAGPSPLVHEEHRKIILDPGIYEIGGEREYDYGDEDLKKVAD